MSKQIDDYLMEGIHGQKETKPDERRKFLGTIRERIIIALTQSQIREEGIYPQVDDAFKNNSKAQLFLNGNMNYSELSKYTKLAAKYKIEYTMVTNKEYNSEIGLVLAYSYAIDKEEIFVSNIEEKEKSPTDENKKGMLNIFSKMFKRRSQ